MGFMDKLKEIGLGNTGPRGRMNSGATNYANYAQDRAALESERQAAQVKSGIAQALALEAKSGKMIPYDKFVNIAEKWGVPVQEVSTPGKDLNDGLKIQTIKNQTHEAMQQYASKKKEDPNWSPTEADIKNEAILKQWLPETMGILKDYVVKSQKPTAVPDSSRLVSVGKNNKINVLLDSKEKTEKPEKKSDLLVGWENHKKNIGPISLAKYKTDFWEKGSGSGGGKDTDFERSYKQHIAIPGNENVTRAQFKTGEYATPTGNLTDGAALEALQNHAYTIDEKLFPQFVAEYNKHMKTKGMSRAEAVQKVISQDRSVEAEIPYPAAQFKGKVILDQESGKKYKSDGTTWIETK